MPNRPSPGELRGVVQRAGGFVLTGKPQAIPMAILDEYR